jgi:hypothetical protein
MKLTVRKCNRQNLVFLVDGHGRRIAALFVAVDIPPSTP